MKIHSTEFVASAASPEECPPADRPEFAFIGRSNVGKSSLINCLTRKPGLAKVSGTPGKTRRINFFLVNDAWRLVDLPGYGYAKVGNREHAGFVEAAAAFLATRECLKQVFALVDARIEPQPVDLALLQWLQDNRLPHSVLFTKADKPGSPAVAGAIERFHNAVREAGLAEPAHLVCSAKSGAGRREILARIGSFLPQRQGGGPAHKDRGKGKSPFDWVRRIERK